MTYIPTWPKKACSYLWYKRGKHYGMQIGYD